MNMVTDIYAIITTTSGTSFISGS